MSTEAPVDRSIATLQSRSQLEPGKTMTAAFMAAPLGGFGQAHSSRTGGGAASASGAGKGVLKVKAAAVGPRRRKVSILAMPSSTVGMWPAGTHHNAM